LVPFGKTTYEGDVGNITFTCPFGEKQCYGNKMQVRQDLDLNPRGLRIKILNGLDY
jgi:hypothetical protein